MRQFVEQAGLLFEGLGVPRMAGRILGWLLICDPPYQSMGDLVEALQASKSSISTMLRLLAQSGLIERTSLPGHRRDQFVLHSSMWHNLFRARMAQHTAFRTLAERGLALIEDRNPEQRTRLAQMRDVHAFVEREYPALLGRWERDSQLALGKTHQPDTERMSE
ncbi:MAG TPA: MarR family transcriptional regulator, partial [Anaerolineae bacterium]|nr:MarR family transcriptional regulator [Anaerolineae bacterium]